MGSESSDLTLKAVRTFLDAVHLASPGEVSGAAAAAAAVVGWTVRLYVTDYEQRVLVPVPVHGAVEGEVLQIDDTLAGRAFRHVQPVTEEGPPLTLWVPLLDGTHRFGVAELGLPSGTDVDDPVIQERYRLLTDVVGHLIAAKNPYGDAMEILSRRRARTVACELLSDLLPPLTFGCPGLVISGILEPCYDVAADAFDYSVIGHVAHFAIFDATGHDLSGTLLAAVALGAYRNSRREGRDLAATARTIDEVLAKQWSAELFATGVLGELDLTTGRLRYINAGHPAPLLMRGGKVVKRLDEGRRILFGLGHHASEVAEEWLESDDWVVLYSDGITEARSPEGAFFGLDRFTDHLERAARSGEAAPETLRRLVHEVLDHQDGRLQDDATILIAQWASEREQRLWPQPT